MLFGQDLPSLDIVYTQHKSPAWMSEMRDKYDQQVPSRPGTLLEQHLLLRLLEMNSNRLSPSAAETMMKMARPSQKDWVPSFLLPVGAMNVDSRDEISIDAKKECAVCGVKSNTHCGGCRRVFYCSQGHKFSYIMSNFT